MKRMRVLFLIVVVFCSLAVKGQLNTERVMTIGRNALYFEDYVLSIKYFNMVIGVRPLLSEPYFYRGLAKYYLDDFNGASEDLTLSIERNPYVSNCYQLRGLCRVKMEQYDSAEVDFRNALRFQPQNIGYWNNLILVTMQQERWNDAELLLDSLNVISPRNADVYLMRTQVSVKKGDTLVALKWADEAVLFDKYSSNVYSVRANLLSMKGEYEAAEKDMDRAIELMPGLSNNYINRALIRFYRGNLRGAMSDYDMALDVDSDNLLGYYNRGLLRFEVGDDNRAIEDFDKVLEIDKENTLARFNRALLRDRTGDLKGAIEDYSVVINEYPNFVYGYQCRAAARKKTGDVKGASEDETWLLKKQIEQYNNAHSGKQDTLVADKSKTRKRSDKNVRNYNKIVIADDENAKKYVTAYRGKVQNRKIDVQLEPMFVVSYYEKPHELNDNIRYYKPLEDINERNFFPYWVLLTNNERALSENEVQRHFDDMNMRSKYITEAPEDMSHRVSRALDFCLVQDFASALDDLTAALAMDGDLWLVYFMRATVRYKLLESESFNGNSERQDILFGGKNRNELPNLDYHLVKNDLTHVINIMPDFSYAYYNRGNVFTKLGDFKSAVIDYGEAIKIDNNFAEAYFNRGLSLIYLGKTSEGIADLSKAGELGLYSAYSIIKKFKE